MRIMVIECDGPGCTSSIQVQCYKLGQDESEIDKGWYTLHRGGFHDSHFCSLHCLWYWSKSVALDPTPFYVGRGGGKINGVVTKSGWLASELANEEAHHHDD